MRLARIEIENFKGVGAAQRIQLRPITLLFGPNSAGKSTLLQALHYMREILERQNIDPDLTIAGGLTDLGGFATLVHNHELDRAVRIKVTLDLSEEQGVDALPLNSGLHADDTEFQELQLRYLLGESAEHKDYAIVQQAALAVEVRWSELERAPYVSRFSIELDGEPFAAIVSPPQAGRAQLTDFNFAHPLLRRTLNADEEQTQESDAVGPSSPLEDEISNLAREVALDRSTDSTPDDKFRIAVATAKGALPDFDRDLALDLRDPEVKRAELEQQTPCVVGLRRPAWSGF
jgi:hypothetical protein